MNGHRIQRFLFHFGEKRTIHRLPIAVSMFATRMERLLAFQKLNSALALIQQYAPEKLNTLRCDVSTILVAGDPGFRGRYIHKLGMVELYDNYILKERTTPEELACVLIHEAQHARLRRLGYGYDERIRSRIEMLCFRAQRNFAKLLPDRGDLVEWAESWLEADEGLNFSDEARRQADLRALRGLGCPAWIVNIVGWISRRRAA